LVQISSPQFALHRSNAKVYSVLEVVTEAQKQCAYKLHSQKSAFAHELSFLKARIFDNETGAVQCRTWLLSVECGSEAAFAAAVTTRINPYIKKSGFAWAQIMNLSVCVERQGYGTRLVAGLEELLWRDNIDVIALYPVQNNRADNFWKSIGYGLQPESLLPQEELEKALLTEGYVDNGIKRVLPRWEKEISRGYTRPPLAQVSNKRRKISLADGSEIDIDTQEERSWKVLDRSRWPLWRLVDAECCKLDGDELEARFNIAVLEKLQRREAMPPWQPSPKEDVRID
jgi:hypothetical protein